MITGWLVQIETLDSGRYTSKESSNRWYGKVIVHSALSRARELLPVCYGGLIADERRRLKVDDGARRRRQADIVV